MALGQSPNPEKVRYTWWYERWQWHSGPKQFCVTQVTCRLVTWCLRFYAVRSSRTAAAEALLVGELPRLTRPRPQLSWNGKRLPHARNTQSPENRNMVAVDRGRSIRYSCMLMYLLYSIIFVFEWGDVLLITCHELAQYFGIFARFATTWRDLWNTSPPPATVRLSNRV